MKKLKVNKLFALVIISALMFIPNLGYFHADLMEARNFVSAEEMVDEGNWLLTTMNGLPRYEKPPLPTWLSAFMEMIFGQKLWAMRLPAGLMSVFLVIYFYKIINLLTNNKNLAFISGAILSTAFLVVYIGRRAEWDIFSYSFMLIGIYHLLKTLMTESEKWKDYILAGVFFGLSFLSKGPTGIYVILVPVALAYVLAYKFPSFKKIGGWITVMLIMTIVGLSWYAYIYVYDKEMLLWTLEKEALARGNRSVKSVFRYFSFPIQMGAWTLFSAISLAIPYMKKIAFDRKTYFFFFYWTLICFVLLSIMPSKKERYLVPLMIPLAATTGFFLYHLLRGVNLKKWEIYFSKIAFFMLGFIAISTPLVIVFMNIKWTIFSVTFALTSVLVGIYLMYNSFKSKFEKSFSGTILLMISMSLLGMPVIASVFTSNENYKSLISYKDEINETGLKLYSYGVYSPEIWFKYEDVIPDIDLSKEETIPSESEFYLIVPPKDKRNKEYDLSEIEKLNWKLILIEEFDDNEENERMKNYTTRKLHRLYKVKK